MTIPHILFLSYEDMGSTPYTNLAHSIVKLGPGPSSLGFWPIRRGSS